MKGDSCQFCTGDLTVVEGLLGPQLFCATCRRFQPPGKDRFTEPVSKTREEREPERAGNTGRKRQTGT